MKDKAAVTIGKRQVDLVLAPRALCSLSACGVRMGGASLVKRPRRAEAEEPTSATRFIMIASPRVCIDYRRTYHRQKWNGVYGLTFPPPTSGYHPRRPRKPVTLPDVSTRWSFDAPSRAASKNRGK